MSDNTAADVALEYTGGSVSYYRVTVKEPINPNLAPYIAECNDIIQALGMSYTEGNAFKQSGAAQLHRT